jgi:hypothetical protein
VAGTSLAEEEKRLVKTFVRLPLQKERLSWWKYVCFPMMYHQLLVSRIEWQEEARPYRYRTGLAPAPFAADRR